MAEVAWAIQANHGGGYQYRLCKKSEKPTEECFQVSARVLKDGLCRGWLCLQHVRVVAQRTPLEYVGSTTTIRMENHQSQPDFEIPAMDTTIGTSPPGSAWRRNPIPACNCDLGEEAGPTQCGSGLGDGTVPYEIDPQAPTKTPRCPTGVQFPPAWPEGYGYGSEYHAPGSEKPVDPHSPGKPTCAPAIYRACGSGRGPTMKTCEACIAEHQAELTAAGCTRTMAEGFCAQAVSSSFYSLQDNVRVPEEKGEYLLSFRWDCEQTAQVWNTW